MEDTDNFSDQNERVSKEVPQLLTLLKQMNEGLDVVRSKVQALTMKVKEAQFSNADGISYLEAKHLLLLSYCKSIVYYLLRKAKGFSIEGHPVVRSLVEIRLFLEKETGVYRPPKFVPTSMEDEKISKLKKMALRKEKETLRRARQNDYTRDLMNELEGKPEEERNVIGAESAELRRFKDIIEKRDRQEEELFSRAPVTKKEKRMKKHMKSRNGLIGLTEGFYDESKLFATEEDGGESIMSFGNASRGGKKYNKRKEELMEDVTLRALVNYTKTDSAVVAKRKPGVWMEEKATVTLAHEESNLQWLT